MCVSLSVVFSSRLFFSALLPQSMASSSSITPNGVALILSNPTLASPPTDIVLQVVDLKALGGASSSSSSSSRFTFLANDGSMKIKAMLPTSMSAHVHSGKIQNLGLLRIQDYTCNEIPRQTQRVVVVTQCEVVAPALEREVGASTVDDKNAKPEIDMNPNKPGMEHVKPSIKLEVKSKVTGDSLVKSAAQIVQEQRGNAAPAARLGITRRVYPILSLNPYQGNWTIKARVTNKGPLRTFKTARVEGNVFNVELTDEDGTQIQATMFRDAADKFFPKLELGKVYYISKGNLRVANKLFATVKNDYEMTLNSNSEVEEVLEERTKIPETIHKFIRIDELGPYVNGRELVDVIGVAHNVSPVVTIRRKSNNDELPKREITIADQSQKTVVVSLWNEMALKEGAELLDRINNSPVVMIHALRVGDFQGVSLSTTMNSVLTIDPNIPEASMLRSWFDTEGKDAHLTSAGASLPGGNVKTSSRSMYADREFLSEITRPSVGEGKPAYFNLRAFVTVIKPDQTMWYLACQTCNRKVTEELGSRYWCEGCQKHFEVCNRRYIMAIKMSDFSGEAWVSAFNEQAENMLGYTADELAELRSQDLDQKSYQNVLKKVLWTPYLCRVSAAQTEYMNEKRQRISIRSLAAVDWSAECKLLLEQIGKLSRPA